MSELRRLTRRTAQEGAYLYATVEALYLGKATVRLRDGGARMTGLPVVGEGVEVGKQCIIEHVTDGQPYVRAVTVPQSYDAFSSRTIWRLTEGDDEKDPPPGTPHVIACRLTYEEYDQFGNPAPQVITSGPGYTQVFFNQTVFDTNDMAGSNEIVFPEDGRYYIRATIAYDSPGMYGLSFLLKGNYMIYWPISHYEVYRHSITYTRDPTDNYKVGIVHFSSLWTFYAGESTSVWAAGTKLGATPRSYSISMIPGRYPILEAVKVAPLIADQNPEAHREWWVS